MLIELIEAMNRKAQMSLVPEEAGPEAAQIAISIVKMMITPMIAMKKV